MTTILDKMTTGWLPQHQSVRGWRNPHLWIITSLMVLCTLNYYADQLNRIGAFQANFSFFTTVHDVHRTLFFIPIIYASLLFRVRGALITSGVFLCVILPRALFVSPYPDALLRPLLFVFAAAFISLLLATQLNRIKKETQINAELKAAYQELSDAHCQLKESQDQLIQAEKVTLIGELAASFVHEAKNPIAAAIVLTKLLSKELPSNAFSKETALECVTKIQSALIRSNSLIENMLNFSRRSTPRFEPCNINCIIEHALELTGYCAKGHNVDVITEFSASVPEVIADGEQLQQVYVNLILNAIQAMPERGRLTIQTSTDNDDWLITKFQDTGCGISPENMKKLFAPFFTTKEKGKGVGLGLTVCNEIIHRHHGRIEVKSKERVGTTFAIYLPLHLEAEQEEIKSLGRIDEPVGVVTSV